MNNSDKLSVRTNLKDSFGQLLASIESNYSSIGKIQNSKPIEEGYEDANYLLTTERGKFVLKIFNKNRNLEMVESYVKIFTECRLHNISVIEILMDFNDGLGIFENGEDITYYMITKFFEGKNYQNITPQISEMLHITEILAKLNTLNFPVVEDYDSWGNKNLAKEYELNKDKMGAKENPLVGKSYEEFLSIDWSGFGKSVIHGDMQRKHVLKSGDELRILDFGCAAFDYKVIDLSTYLAWFCLQEDTWKDSDLIYKEVVEIYNRTHHLSQSEIKALPILIRAAYAAYYLKTSVLINDGDNSDETIDWYKKSKIMLELSQGWSPTTI